MLKVSSHLGNLALDNGQQMRIIIHQNDPNSIGRSHANTPRSRKDKH